MKLKIEFTALLLGIIGAIGAWLLVNGWSDFPTDIRELFRGGQPGGVLVGVSLLLGFIGIALFLINVIIGQRKLWWLRFLGVIVFLIITINFSTFV